MTPPRAFFERNGTFFAISVNFSNQRYPPDKYGKSAHFLAPQEGHDARLAGQPGYAGMKSKPLALHSIREKISVQNDLFPPYAEETNHVMWVLKIWRSAAP